MKKTINTLLAATFLLGGAAYAESESHSRSQFGTGGLPEFLKPYDLDSDGMLSDAEKLAARNAIAAKIAETRSKRFDELDINKNGFLTPAEVAAVRGAATLGLSS